MTAEFQEEQEKGHKAFLRDFGGKVYTVMHVNGTVPADVEQLSIAECDLLLKLQLK